MLRIRRFPSAAIMLEPNGALGVECLSISARICAIALKINPASRQIMVITATELSPIVALIAGVLILIVPRLLNIIVAIYLIIEGLVGLNAVHHFFH
jgi:hypothetical protein